MGTSAKDQTTATGCRILVVDDEENVRLLIERGIRDLGHLIVFAENAAAAIAEIKGLPFDVVITDVRMPGLDGIELTEWIKDTTPETEVIIITGYASVDTAAEAVRLGAFDYLMKPFGEIELVMSCVNRAVEKRSLEKGLRQLTAERNRAEIKLSNHARALESRNHELELIKEQLQYELVRTENLAAIGRVSGGVAHDLRNPLGAIRNAVYLIKHKIGSIATDAMDPQVFICLDVIDDQLARSDRVISDLLSFAHIRVPVLASTRIDSVIDEALGIFVRRESVKVSTYLDPGLGTVMADREQLLRVFLNLANNAQEAMPDGGELTVSGKRGEGHVEVSFADTGGGIPIKNVDKVFDPLFTTKTEGTGLGLAVCQEIVNQHGGAIRATNISRPGGGAIFTVSLPAVTP